ncbi:hypothetical protein EDD11_003533 [Mortierella claussenii]|nr:hypothetical protein EDD11_003533 [Mortierella claussenii]
MLVRVVSDPAVLEKEVPGIGRYTAGAIVSHAYNVPAELVDGNVIRVLSRLRAIGGDVKNPKVVDLHWLDLGSLELKRSRKEAMGAPQKRTMKDDDEEEDNGDMCTLCLPETEVEGKDQGLVTQYPRKAVKKAPRDEGGSISEFLLVKRPEKGLLAGMWEFPTVEQDQLQRDHFADTKHNNNTHKKQTQRSTTTNPAIASSESIPLPLTTYKQRAESSLQYLTNTLGQDWILKDSNAKDIQRRDLGNVQHLFSHIRKVYHVEWILIHVSGNEKVVQKDNTLATAKRKGGNGPEIQWLTAKELATAAIPTGINKTYQLLQKHKAGEFTQEHTAAGASGNGRGNKRKKMERVSDSSKDKKVKKKEGHSDISKFFKAPAK